MKLYANGFSPGVSALVFNITEKYSNSSSQRHQLSTRQFCSAAGNNLGLVPVRTSWSSEGWCIMWKTGGHGSDSMIDVTPTAFKRHTLKELTYPLLSLRTHLMLFFSQFLNTFQSFCGETMMCSANKDIVMLIFMFPLDLLKICQIF